MDWNFTRRFDVVPLWLKVAPIIVLIIFISMLHGHMRAVRPDLVPLVRHAYYLPLFMASVLFGLRGGLICAFFISLNYAEDLFGHSGLPVEQRLYLAMSVSAYYLVGIITGLLIDRERREAARLKKMREMAALGQAAAALAHEMKTPLIAIGGFAVRICRDLPEDDPHREKLRIIVDQVAHMEQLLREVLDYSRPVQLHLQQCALRDVVRGVLDLAGLLAEESGVRLWADLAETPVEAEIDKGRISQVLLNLVQNAVQASPVGGKVRVSTRRDGDHGLIEVSDEGSGINEEDVAKIFDPFFTTKRKGTGLGLAITKKIVEAHGGDIRLQSNPGRGSTFTVRLPLYQANHAAA